MEPVTAQVMITFPVFMVNVLFRWGVLELGHRRAAEGAATHVRRRVAIVRKGGAARSIGGFEAGSLDQAAPLFLFCIAKLAQLVAGQGLGLDAQLQQALLQGRPGQDFFE